MPIVTKEAPPITPVTVANEYDFVVGVDTHAATHGYAIIEAPNGGLVDQQTFSTSAGDWAARGTGSLGAPAATS